MDIRVELKKVLDERCLNQAAVARKAGLTPMQLSDALHMRRKLDANELFRICDAIGISPEELRPNSA